MNSLLIEFANLSRYPPRRVVPQGCHVAVGDLHGNAIKFLYILISHGFLEMEEAAYLRAFIFYQSLDADFFPPKLPQVFEKILNGLTVNNLCRLILCGDETGDRGKCDLPTLQVMDLLTYSGINFDILFSNHGFELICAYETSENFFPTYMPPSVTGSLIALDQLIKQGQVTREEILALIDRAYKPHLRALFYSLDPERGAITFLGHAAIEVKHISYLAKKLGVVFQDEHPLALAETIERINAIFTQEYVNKNRVHTLIDPQRIRSGLTIDAKLHPFEYLMWNRNYEGMRREEVHRGYPVFYGHGHDPDGITNEHIFNLDNEFGKFSDELADSVEHRVLYTYGKQVAQLTAQERAQLSIIKEPVVPFSPRAARGGPDFDSDDSRDSESEFDADSESGSEFDVDSCLAWQPPSSKAALVWGYQGSHQRFGHPQTAQGGPKEVQSENGAAALKTKPR